jgi:hypothetical protein
MKNLLVLAIFFIPVTLNAQQYYVLHVVGNVTTENEDTVRMQDQYTEGQKFNFEDSLALIVFLNEKAGKVVLKPGHEKTSQSHQTQNSNTLRSPKTNKKDYLFSEIIALNSQELLPLTSSTFTRGSMGIVNQPEDFEIFFQTPHLLLDTIAIDYNQGYFPTGQEHYFFLEGSDDKKQKVFTRDGQLLLTEVLFKSVDSSDLKQKVFHSELFQHKNQNDYPITEVTIVIVEDQQLQQQATMIIEATKKDEPNKAGIIEQIHLFFSELYGSCSKDEVKAWLTNRSLL